MLTVGVERLQIVLIFGVGEIYKNHVGGIVVGDHYCNRSDIKRNIGRPRISHQPGRRIVLRTEGDRFYKARS